MLGYSSDGHSTDQASRFTAKRGASGNRRERDLLHGLRRLPRKRFGEEALDRLDIYLSQ